MRQSEAFNLLKMGKNVFLTGAAGSGKTFLLNKYISYLKDNSVRIAVTASTGIAATHLHGMTIHAWSGIGVRDWLTPKDLEKIQESKRLKRNYKRTKVLIIDEISMLHSHQLDMIDTIARLLLNSDKPFGGMQVILCGDFFQLPPVSSGSKGKEKIFAFEADAWINGNFHICYLHEQHRQDNDQLLTILNDIRSGTAGEQTKIPLRTRYKKEPLGATRATKLYTHNVDVNSINEKELAKIKHPAKQFTMETMGYSALVEGLKRSCLAQEQLTLKLGTEVMFIKNDQQGEYVNGTRGVVIGFNKNENNWPIVKTYNNKIINAFPAEWNYEDNGVVRATLTQVPLRLAWAITVHKSQGMTLDAAEIDLGNAFEPGMGYVALSRVRSLSGLKLMNLNEIALTVQPKILQYDKILQNNSKKVTIYLSSLSIEEITESQKETLINRFGGGEPKKINSKKSTVKSSKLKTPTHIKTLELLKEGLLVEAIAEKREVTISTILSHIEKLKGLKLIDNSNLEYLKSMVTKQDFDIIYTELQKSTDGRLRPIYDLFDGKYSFISIQVVRLFV